VHLKCCTFTLLYTLNETNYIKVNWRLDRFDGKAAGAAPDSTNIDQRT